MVKISKNAEQDIARFQNLAKDREICIKQASNKKVVSNYPSNELASKLHPKFFFVRVKRVVEETHDTKTFWLELDKNQGTDKFPMFQAGQYITLEVPILDGVYKRAYSISCSSKHLKNNEISITVKRVEKGIVSNYFLDEVKIGDSFKVHGPFGDFTYSSLRDQNRVVAICGGSGITPIMAFAESIQDGILPISMTILYGSKTEEDIIFHNRFDEISRNCSKVKVIYVLSEEEKDGFEHGFITKELIEKYQLENCSYFVCGPIGLYRSMNDILKSMNISNKYIRHDLYMNYKCFESSKTYELTVLTQNEEKKIKVNGHETLMQAMERASIVAPKRCGVGVCGFCRSKLVAGEVLTNDEYVREADKKYHYIHPCATYPISDVVIRLPF